MRSPSCSIVVVGCADGGTAKTRSSRSAKSLRPIGFARWSAAPSRIASIVLVLVGTAVRITTGGGLVFTGDAEGFFTAYESQTGKVLWTFQCGSGHHSAPITYSLDGRQYIAVCVGWGGWTAGFAGDGAPWLKNARRGNTLFVFKLPDDDK